MLEIKTSYHGGILNVELFGSLDSLTSPDFKQWLTDKASSGYHYFALNCSGLEFMSSRGISVIIELNNILNDSQLRLILYQLSNEVENLLDFLKLSNSIPVAENFAQVREKFGNSPLKDQATDFRHHPGSGQKHHVEGIPKTNDTETNSNLSSGIEPAGRQDSVEHLPDENSSDENYIDLSSRHYEKHGEDLSIINIIFCPNCGEKLKVSKKGLYLCPECRNKFNYPFN